MLRGSASRWSSLSSSPCPLSLSSCSLPSSLYSRFLSSSPFSYLGMDSNQWPNSEDLLFSSQKFYPPILIFVFSICITTFILILPRQAIHFISSCLAWLPEDRMSPTQALRQGSLIVVNIKVQKIQQGNLLASPKLEIRQPTKKLSADFGSSCKIVDHASMRWIVKLHNLHSPNKTYF